MEASKEHYEALKDFQLNDAPNTVLDALYLTYQSRTYSCCFRFFCCCCVPGADEFTAESLREKDETVLANLVQALEDVKVKTAPSQSLRSIKPNPLQLLQGEIQKTKGIIDEVKKGNRFKELDQDYIEAIIAIQDPIFDIEDSKQQQEAESIDSFDRDF